MPIEYAPSSSIPKGDASSKASGGRFEISGSVAAIAEKATPVEPAVYTPHPIPAAGMNIGIATDALWTNIPIESISCVVFENSFKKILVCSSDILYIAPMEYENKNMQKDVPKTRAYFFLDMLYIHMCTWIKEFEFGANLYFVS